MVENDPSHSASKPPKWLTDLVRAEPRAPLMAPFMAYLLLMLLNDVLPTSLQPLSIALHIGLAGWVAWLFRHHYPPLGRPCVVAAVAVGILATLVWVAGQDFLDDIQVAGTSLGNGLTWRPPFLLSEPAAPFNPHDQFGQGWLFWSHVVLKICRAVTIVPIVEELFWRGFILRAFVSWDRFETVPWGSFAWRAFLGSSLLSVLQHPNNWGVSILCWLLYNGLFYWKKSLKCSMIAHGVTNLALYLYVVFYHDWRFW